jgi:hypothetical protein
MTLEVSISMTGEFESDFGEASFDILRLFGVWFSSESSGW